MIELKESSGEVLIPVKAVPGASRDRFVGLWAGRAKIVVSAPPEGGKANKAICTLLAKLLDVRKGKVKVVRGLSSPIKTVSVAGVSIDHVKRLLS